MIFYGTPDPSDPTPRVQAIEAAEDRAEQVAFDAWREREQ